MDAPIAPNVVLQYGFHSIAILFVVWLVYQVVRYGSRERDLPPGPPTTWGIGNIHLIPKRDAYLQMSRWAGEYGAIYSLKVGHQTIIVLNTAETVHQLMEKGSNYTQGRPFNWLLTEYAYNHDHLSLTDIPSKVSTFRRAYTKMLNSKAVLDYTPVQEAESLQLLHDILVEPTSFYDNIRRFTFSVILSVTFGIRASTWESATVERFYDYMNVTLKLFAFGGTPPLDLIPALRWIPEHFAPWKRLAKRMWSEERKLTAGLLPIIQKRIASGCQNGSFIEDVFENRSSYGMTDDMIRIFGAEALGAGAETTASFLLSAIQVLVGEAESQGRIQEELDRIVGPHRLPTLSDVPNLPYFRAVIKEMERIRPVAPLGIPHRVTADHVYKGYRIPKDATIIANT